MVYSEHDVKLSEIAERLACRLEGDGNIEVWRVASIERADAGDLTFFANPRYKAALVATRASAVILADDAPPAPCAMLRTANPYLAFAAAVQLFAEPLPQPHGIHRLSTVDPTASLAPDVSVGPFAVVGSNVHIGARTAIHSHVFIGPEARIGDDCIVHTHVAIRERVTIGNRVVVLNGAVIGSDGYGFARRADGTHQKIPQVGAVVIEDDVEIGANTAIDRPAVGETRVRAGTKIDNLVQIAHGVTIGRNVLLAAQVGIAGSTVVEDDVVFAGQVGVAGHLTIGKGTTATAQTGIPNSTEPGVLISGYPAIPNREWLRSSAVFRRLPELKKTVSELERRLAELESKLSYKGSE